MAPPKGRTSTLALEDARSLSATEKGTIRVVSGSGYRFLSPFPFRLHKMLSDVDERGDASIVSWMPDGLHFKVHNPKRFVEEIIPKAFKQKSLKSFQRQLHLYGFQRVPDGPNKGAYWHENFVQNNRELSLSISRIKAPKRRSGAQNTKPVEKERVAAAASTRSQATPAFALSTSEPMVFPDHLSSSSSTSSSETSHPQQGDASVAETYEWLNNVGLPVSAFDPVALKEKFSVRASATELLECADEITSLFASPAANPVRETRVTPLSATLGAAPMPLVPSCDAATLPVSPSIADAAASSEQPSLSLPDFMLGDGFPNIESENWALF